MPKDPVFVCSWNDEVQNYNQVIYSQSIVLQAIKNIRLPLILGNRSWNEFSPQTKNMLAY